MRRILVIGTILFCGLVSPNTNWAEDKSTLTIQEISVLAEASILNELSLFNRALDALRSKQVYQDTGYTDKVQNRVLKDAKYFLRFGIHEVDLEYPLDKCLFNQSDLENLIGTRLTLSDDETYEKKNRLREIRELYGKNFYNVIFGICSRAKDRFSKRLSEVHFKNSDIQIDKKTVQSIAKIIFYPSLHGKPSFLDTLRDHNGIGYSSLVTLAGVGTLFGLVYADLILGLVYLTDDILHLGDRVRQINPELYRLDVVPIQSSTKLEVIFSELENTIAMKSKNLSVQRDY